MASKGLPAALDVQCESVRQFLKGFNSEATKGQYSKKLSQFLEMSRTGPDELLEGALKDPKAVQGLIIDYVEAQRDRVSGSTIGLSISALKHFFAMNDAEDAISWKKIAKVTPRVRKTGSDRSPTVQEIRQMMEAADVRTKCIILMCASSGIRVGAFEDMRWGDVTPVPAREGGSGVRAARLLVYRGSVEEYVTFVTPECHDMLLRYRTMREEIGERVTAESPLIRDSWDSHPYRKDVRKDPRAAAPISPKTISNMMGRFLKKANMRGAKRAGSAMHEFKQIHGFRKFFKTNAERTMKTLDVEKLMGHAENYYKPSEEYLLEQYAGAVPNLTMSEEEELRRAIRSQAEAGDKKVGEMERENSDLQERIVKLESSYASVREILENVLTSKAGGR